jgi:hypothetical protein
MRSGQISRKCSDWCLLVVGLVVGKRSASSFWKDEMASLRNDMFFHLHLQYDGYTKRPLHVQGSCGRIPEIPMEETL